MMGINRGLDLELPNLILHQAVRSVILTEDKPVQPQKASHSMLFTLSGMVMEVRPEQSWYLQVALFQLFVC